MQIIFRKVEVHNFMSFGDEVFNLDDYRGMNLIKGINHDIEPFGCTKSCGSNGSGKSTIFNAFVYGLYGQLPVKVKTSNISNRAIEDKEVRVAVYLNVNGTEYKAVSGQNKRAQSYFTLSSIENGKEKDLTRSSIAETREFFENDILRCDFSLFLRTIMLTSEQNYSFFKLNASARKEFIEKLFDIGVFGDMFSLIHRDVLNLDKDIIAAQNRLMVLRQQKEDFESKTVDFENGKKSKIAMLTESVGKLERELEDKKGKTVSKNEDAIAKCKLALEKCSTIKDQTEAAYRKLVTDGSSYSSKKDTSLRAIADRKKIIEKHADLKSKLCSDCKKIFSNHYKLGQYEQEITDLEKVVKDAETKMAENTTSKEANRKTYSEIQSKINLINSKISELTREYNEQMQVIRTYEANLAAKRKELSMVSVQENPYLSLIEKNKTDTADVIAQISSLTEREKYLKKAEGIVSQDNIRKFIIKDFLGLINGMVKNYLSKMMARYDCIFDEDFDYSFKTDTGDCELGNFSCGETMKLSLAVNFAFRDFMAQRSAITSNVLFIDEYLDSGIDTPTLSSVMEIMKDYTRTGQNVFVISHRPELSDEDFNHIIFIEKKDGVSHIRR